MRNKRIVLSILIAFIIILMSFSAFAASCISSIGKDDVLNDDYYSTGQTVRNDGTIKGDLVAASQNLYNNGTIEGDLLGAAGELTIGGRVLGNARVAGGNIFVNGAVEKNVNVFGGNIDFKKSSNIGRNVLVVGGSINLDGKINGTSRIHGDKITLSGEFLGDVEVNMDEMGDDHERSLIVTKDAVIHGKLSFKGSNKATVQDGAKIGDFEWVKVQPLKKKAEADGGAKYFWKFVRLILTTLVYFAFGVLAYKLFPKYFARQGSFIAKKPLNTIGIGLIALIAILASIIIFIVLMLLSIALLSPTVGLVFGSVVLLVYVILFYFSSIPVSVWLGNLILKEKPFSDVKRFGLGLTIITLGFFTLELLSQIPVAGIIFSLVSFITGFVFVVLGIGALLYTLRDIINAVRSENTVF